MILEKQYATLPALQANWRSMKLQFQFPGTTSRGTMTERQIWLLRIHNRANPAQFGLGEAAPLFGLSPETLPEMPSQLAQFCHDLQRHGTRTALAAISQPSIRFAVEMALLDLLGGGQRILFDSPFVQGKQNILINGLIWMNNTQTMLAAIEDKLQAGFSCIKLKIGALNWQEEYHMIKNLRSRFSASEIEIRLDANGAFSADTALNRLKQLAQYDIHSIEQPIAPGQHEYMAKLCLDSPIAIALDEELIGIDSTEQRTRLLETIKPAFIILKPTLLGGFAATLDWINCAKQQDIGWWLTSALESNIGLNALAQWAATLNTQMPQGLGTGRVFQNNIVSPLVQEGEWLHYAPERPWVLGNP